MSGPRRAKRRPTYRARVLEIDPKATIKGPIYIAQYGPLYSVYDAAGIEIGYTDGNEQGASWAWARAHSTLQRRQRELKNG